MAHFGFSCRQCQQFPRNVLGWKSKPVRYDLFSYLANTWEALGASFTFISSRYLRCNLDVRFISNVSRCNAILHRWLDSGLLHWNGYEFDSHSIRSHKENYAMLFKIFVWLTKYFNQSERLKWLLHNLSHYFSFKNQAKGRTCKTELNIKGGNNNF